MVGTAWQRHMEIVHVGFCLFREELTVHLAQAGFDLTHCLKASAS